jgi:glutaminase
VTDPYLPNAPLGGLASDGTLGDHDSTALISTGLLPPLKQIATMVRQAYDRYRDEDSGAVADYIPALAQADPDLFGIALVGVAGQSTTVGDAQVPFSIQSVSKAFVFALVLDALGPQRLRADIGVNASGMAFNSVLAVELNPDRTVNPMVNAGAIATTSLVPGDDAAAKWRFVQQGLSAFAGHDLVLDEEVFDSELSHNDRNRGVAHLLYGYGRLYHDAEVSTEVYTRQCSLAVTALDLATMGATLADGGVNPLTGRRVVSAETAKRTLAVLATAGMYEQSGEWLFDVGLPGKSGVGGAIVTMAPGKGALAVFSPPLDAAGNSVRGQLVTSYLSNRLGLDLFASAPVPGSKAPLS